MVLPHFLQNFRYIQSDTDVKKEQTSLEFFLACVLHVDGNYTEYRRDEQGELVQYGPLTKLIASVGSE